MLLRDVGTVIFKAFLLLFTGIVVSLVTKSIIPPYNKNQESKQLTLFYISINLLIITLTTYVISRLFIKFERDMHAHRDAVWLLSILVSTMFAAQPDTLNRLSSL